MEMSITRALNEVKLLDKRINDKIASASFISCVKKSSKKATLHETREEFIKKAKSDYASITDLIKRKENIKKAIDNSNLITSVKVGNETMTVTEALNKRNNIMMYEKTLLEKLEYEYNTYLAECSRRNEKVEREIYELLITMVGSDKVNKSDEKCKSISDTYRENNEYELIDPLNLKKLIEKKRTEIDMFDSEIDFILSESNSITKIEVN